MNEQIVPLPGQPDFDGGALDVTSALQLWQAVQQLQRMIVNVSNSISVNSSGDLVIENGAASIILKANGQLNLDCLSGGLTCPGGNFVYIAANQYIISTDTTTIQAINDVTVRNTTTNDVLQLRGTDTLLGNETKATVRLFANGLISSKSILADNEIRLEATGEINLNAAAGEDVFANGVAL